MVETSVIIPCWIIDKTLLQLTQRCVQSIRDTSKVELVIVDNGSTLGTDFMMEEADVYMRNKENLGYVRAINQGILVSSGKYIVCGNNDYKMTEGWEAALKKPLSYAAVSCPHVSGTDKRDGVELGTPGGWWMVERGTIAKVGLLDEQFFNVHADFDFTWRLKKNGMKVVTTSEVTVDHLGKASLDRFEQHDEERDRGARLLVRKWAGDPFTKQLLEEVGLS